MKFFKAIWCDLRGYHLLEIVGKNDQYFAWNAARCKDCHTELEIH